MKTVMRSLAALTSVVLLTLFFGAPALHAAASEMPAAAPAELAEDLVPVPEQGCDVPAAAPAIALQPPEATPASGSSGSFYVCFGNDNFCGGCPSGTRCATEACGSRLNPKCTFQVSCVSSCAITNCTAIANNCF